MRGLRAMIKAGWQMAQSAISSIGGVLFSSSPENSTTRRPIGLNQLIQTKNYWVDHQRELFAELREADALTPESLQAALDGLLDQLGARLGSPAVMLLELAQLQESLADGALLAILRDAKASIQASMIKDPEVTYDNLMADIQLLRKDTSMKFINSLEGREWLGVYRTFFNNDTFENALLRIESFANSQLGELYGTLRSQRLQSEVISAKIEQAENQIKQFKEWRVGQRYQSRQSIEPKALEILRTWDAAENESEQDQDTEGKHIHVKISSCLGIFSGMLRLLKLPVTLMNRYPKLSGGLLLVSRAAIAVAQAYQRQHVYTQTRDVSGEFRGSKLNADEFAQHIDEDGGFSVQDITQSYKDRHLQEASETCFAGIKQQGWMQTLGGANSDGGNGIAVGSAGQIVLVGQTQSYGAGRDDVLLAQFSAEGELQWAQTLGGADDDMGYGVEIGPLDQIVMVGRTESYGAGSVDVLLAQLSAEGELQWALTLGGADPDEGYGVALGSAGQIVLVGSTRDYGAGSDDVLPDVLLARFSAVGELQWAQKLGGAKSDRGIGVALGPAGQIVVVGNTVPNYGLGYSDLLLAQFSADGELQWALTLGGADTEVGNGVALGSSGQIVLVGETKSYGAGEYDALLAQVSAEGKLEWAQTLGGTSNERGYDVTLGPAGQIVLVGTTGNDGLLAQYSAEGELEWAEQLGGTSSDSVASVALGSAGQIVLVGSAVSFGAGSSDVLLALFGADSQLEGLSSDVSKQPVTDLIHSDRINTITNQTISVASQNVTGNVVSNPQTELGINIITNEAVIVYSARVNKSSIEQLTDPILTEEYTLPLSNLLISTHSVLAVDLTSAIWLRYDIQNQQLIGTPLLEPLKKSVITLTVELANNAGVVTADLALCVKSLGSFVSDSLLLGGSENDVGTGVAIGPQGQTVLVGKTRSNIAGGYDVLLAQVSTEGDMQWARTIGGTLYDDGSDVALGPEGQIVLAGRTKSYGAGDYDVLLAQFSAEGELQWARTLGGTLYDEGSDVALGPAGQIVLVGRTKSYGAGNYDVLLAQFNAEGELHWAQTLGGTSYDECDGVAIGPAGQIVLVGSTWRYGEGGWGWDVVLAKVSTEGNLEWAQTLGGDSYDEGTGVAIGLAGQIVLIGTTESYGMGIRDVLMAQIDAEGEMQWARTLGEASWDLGKGVAIDVMGQIVLVGSTQSYGAGGYDVLLAKLSAEGELQWARTFGGTGHDYGFGVALGPQGQIVLVGSTESYGAGADDLLAVKLDSQGITTHQNGLIVNEIAISCVDVSPAVNNFTEIQANAILGASNMNIIGLQGFPLVVPAVHRVTFNANFELRFKQFIRGFRKFFSVAIADAFTLPSWLSVDRVNLVLSGMPIGDVRGQYTIRIDAELAGGRKWISFILDVVNTAPYFTQLPHFSSDVGRFVLPIGSYFADKENDLIGPFSIGRINGTQAAPIASVDPDTGRFFGTTLSGDQGRYRFNITASDPYGGLGWEIITLEIANAAPVRAYAFEQRRVVTIGGNPLHYDFPSNAFADPDGDVVSYQAILPAFLGFDSASRLISGRPDTQDIGIHEAFVLAHDPYNGIANVSILIDVNSAPRYVGTLRQLATSQVGEYFQADLPNDLFVDQQGDEVSFRLTEDVQHPRPSWLDFDETNRILSGIPIANPHRAQPIRFIVSDGRGGEVFYDLDLLVPNSPPAITQSIAVQRIEVNRVRTLVAANAFGDADGDALSFDLSLVSGGAQDWLSVANGVVTFLPRSGAQGTHQLRLNAYDAYGGASELLFSATVPNTPPALVYVIPPASVARAGQAWTKSIASDNFIDADSDPLTFVAHQSNGSALPGWITFDSARRVFHAMPRGVDRGIWPLTVSASDGFGGSVQGYFNVSVVNTVPVANSRVFDQDASQTESSYTFTVPTFYDVDGDAVNYSTRLNSGEPLPTWLNFNPSTRVFTSNPSQAAPGNYLIDLVVTDSQGQTSTTTFNMAIQAPPVIDSGSESATEKYLQYIIGALASICALGGLSVAIGWRQRRIKYTQQRIAIWSDQRGAKSGAGAQQEIAFEQLATLYENLARRVCFTAHVETLEPNFSEFEGLVMHYYQKSSFSSKPHDRVLLTELLHVDLIGRLIGKISCHILEATKSERSLETALNAAKLLHKTLGIILADYTGKGHKLSPKYKLVYMERLEDLLDRIQVRSTRSIQVYHELICAREAIICMRDTNTMLLLLKSSAKHIVSPGLLLGDLKAIVFNIPSKWYVLLLEASQLAKKVALGDARALQRLQREAWQESDWRYRFGLVNLLLNALLSASSDDLKHQLIEGAKGQLGIKHLLVGKSKWQVWRNDHVKKEAYNSLCLIFDQLPPKQQSFFKSYMVNKETVARNPKVRRPSIVSTPLGSVNAVRSPELAPSVVNPMFAHIVESKPAMQRDRSTRVVSMAPKSVRSGSTDV